MSVVYKNLLGTTAKSFRIGRPRFTERMLGTYAYDDYAVQGSTTATTPPGTLYRQLVTPTLEAGIYRILISLKYAHTATNRDCYVLARFDGATFAQSVTRVSIAGATYYWPVAFQQHVTVATSGSTHTVSIYFYASGATMYIQNSSISIERVK